MEKEKKRDYQLRISQANKAELIVILYEIALDYLDEAVDSHKNRDINGYKDNLKKLRERYGITGAEMAEYLEINCRKYYRYESGESSIPRDTVELLSELFEVSRYEIIAFKHSF